MIVRSEGEGLGVRNGMRIYKGSSVIDHEGWSVSELEEYM